MNIELPEAGTPDDPCVIGVTARLADSDPTVPARIALVRHRDGATVATRDVTPYEPRMVRDDAPRDGYLRAAFDCPDVGAYTAKLSVGGRELDEIHLQHATVPALGGGRYRRLARFHPPRLVHSEEKGTWGLLLARWQPVDDVSSYVIELHHDGELVHSDSGRDAILAARRDELLLRAETMWGRTRAPILAWEYTTQLLVLPPSIFARPAGSWELRVYRSNEDGARSRFTLDAQGRAVGLHSYSAREIHRLLPRSYQVAELSAASIDTPADIARALASTAGEPPKRSGKYTIMASSPAELRALTRSGALFDKRLEMNGLNTAKGATVGHHYDSEKSPEQNWVAAKRAQRETDQSYEPINRKRRQRARKLLPGYKRELRDHLHPWTASEHPLGAGSGLTATARGQAAR
jgi:hypothetical protein